ncbi:MAG: shikimate dehydrogenase [Elusimicrobia bacterium CG11_big_fil_rev_8_21_14_0_20_64_6]|nr:MAG: shikimate dehydrogenase [Elusimicrobia bacterium CG11_big_fil_rev_8_21_14_0_20_64_6]
MKLGIFGRPIGHSRSPFLFSRLGRLLNKKMSYKAVEVKENDFAATAKRSRKEKWRGASVTIPFKREAARLADRLTPAARAIGAVNVLRFEVNSKISGHNTDADGLLDALKSAGVVMSGVHVLVFGAGGAARAAGYAVAKGGAKTVRFSNRTASTATECVRDLAPNFPRTSFSSGAPRNADIWINATPLGQNGNPDKSPAPKSLRAPGAAVDMVYGKKTAFQRHAERLGARTFDGTAMLVFQALRAYEFWDRPFGPRRRALLAATLIKELS